MLAEEDRVIGQIGGMPFAGTAFGTPFEGVWSVDNIVLLSERSRGIGTMLQRRAEEVVPTTFSTWMSAANLRIKEKIGNRRVCNLDILEAANVQPKAQHHLCSPPEAGTISRFAQRALMSYDLFAVRDPAYCQWRFVDQPFARYLQLNTPFGISLIRTCGELRPQTAMIGDLFTTDNSLDAIVTLTRLSAQHLRAIGAKVVRFGTAAPPIREALIESGQWSLVRTHPILLNQNAIDVPPNVVAFFSLSDADLDQYPW